MLKHTTPSAVFIYESYYARFRCPQNMVLLLVSIRRSCNGNRGTIVVKRYTFSTPPQKKTQIFGHKYAAESRPRALSRNDTVSGGGRIIFFFFFDFLGCTHTVNGAHVCE